RVHNTVGHLARRQAVRGSRVEDGELWINQWAAKAQLFFGTGAGDDGVAVTLGAGCWRGQDAHQRQGRFNRRMLGKDVPGFTIKVDGGSNKLGTVDHAAATDGEQEVDVIFFNGGGGAHQRLILRVRLNAAEFKQWPVLQRCNYLIVNAVLFDGTAAVGEQDPRIGRYQTGELADLVFAKDNAGGVMKRKILHRDNLLENHQPCQRARIVD